jgi:hypothetical protein
MLRLLKAANHSHVNATLTPIKVNASKPLSAVNIFRQATLGQTLIHVHVFS